MSDLILVIDQLSLDLFGLYEPCRLGPLEIATPDLAKFFLEIQLEEYSAVIADPFEYLIPGERHPGKELKSVLFDARDKHHIPVALYSNRSEEYLQYRFELRKGSHYDCHVSKLALKSNMHLRSVIHTMIKTGPLLPKEHSRMQSVEKIVIDTSVFPVGDKLIEPEPIYLRESTKHLLNNRQ